MPAKTKEWLMSSIRQLPPVTGRILLFAQALTAITANLDLAAETPIPIELVAMTGDLAPGSEGAVFNSLSDPKLNDSGTIVFRGQVNDVSNGTGQSLREGIWLVDTTGQQRLLALAGFTPAPLREGLNASFSRFGPPALDPDNNVAFKATLDREGPEISFANNEGIWLSDGVGGFWLVVQKASPAIINLTGASSPGINFPPRFRTLSNPILSTSGTVSFSADLASGVFEVASGVWYVLRPPSDAASANLPSLLTLSTNPLDGEDIRFIASGVGLDLVSVISGLVSIGSSDIEAVIGMGFPGVLEPLYQIGDPAPSTLGEESIYLLGRPAVSSPSLFAFWGGVSSEAIGEGIWLQTEQGTRAIALTGDSIPHGGKVIEFSSFLDPALNNSGYLAFTTYFREAAAPTELPLRHGDQGICFAGPDDVMHLVAQAGFHAPGAPESAYFCSFGSPRIDNRGQVVFNALLDSIDDSVQASTDGGVWAWTADRDPALQPVLRKGQSSELPGAEGRTVTGVAATDFNNAGEIALLVTYDDGSNAIYRARLGSEPSGDPSLFDPAFRISEHWKFLPWFGFFNDSFAGWIYHAEHGWLFTIGESSSDFLVWSFDQGWLWTGQGIYPYFFRLQDGAWIWYQRGSEAPRLFYNFASSAWETFD